MSVQTLSELFLVAAGHDMPNCLLHKVSGSYQPMPTSEVVDRVRRTAAALKEFGVRRGDRVVLMAENGPHWPTVDFATLCSGAVLVPIYPTLTADQAAYIVHDCDAEIAFVQGRERLEGLLELRSEMPQVKQFILIEGESPEAGIPRLSNLLAETSPMDEDEFEQNARNCQPDDIATFIYTSGTTGKPKGVMLTHLNMASNATGALERAIDMQHGWTALTFLPLSHSLERTVDYVYFLHGVSIAYAESVPAIPQNLLEVNPHTFVSVPRIYEKVMAKVHENVASSSPLKQKIFQWATGVARQALPYRLERKRPPGLLNLKVKLADKLVFGKIKARLGSRFHYAVSGGAPLAPDLARFFWGAGIEIYEGYGLSETSPVLTVNSPGRVKLGTVGQPIAHTELKIAADGEILARGLQVMKGYHNLPEATAESFDDEGWFHTGDIGEIDADGYLKITDRKKEIIVNAYGKNVAPAPIENSLKGSRFIGQAVVIGDNRKLLAALLVPDFETLESWATQQSIATGDISALLADPKVQELFRTEVESVNRDLARYEQIRLWQVLPDDFTIETGELTPTQKIKRRVINEKYQDVIESLYNQATP
jgi:long-chain acyl-CoA synthetase